MSNDEMDAQIGRATREYHAAKAKCGHIDIKIARVSLAYRAVGDALMLKNARSEPVLIDGKLQIDRPSENWSLDDLLSKEYLTALIQERDEARREMEDMKATLIRLGLAGID